MTTTTRSIQPLEITSIRGDHAPDPTVRRPASLQTVATAAAAAVVTGAAVWAAVTATAARLGPGREVAATATIVWCLAAVLASRDRSRAALSRVLLTGSAAGALAMAGAAQLGHDHANAVAAAARATGVVMLPALGLHLALALPDGVLRTRTRRLGAAGGYAAAVALATVSYLQRPRLHGGWVLAFAAVAVVAGTAGFVARCRRARTSAERASLQWAAWGALVAAGLSGVMLALHLLVSWPSNVVPVAVGSSVSVPTALAMSASRRIDVRIDRLLVQTIIGGGLAAVVLGCYLLVIVGLGRSPTSRERSIFGASMIGAALAALLWSPARERLADFAARRVYGERHAPDDVLRTFGHRLTRALPLDELLLQLAESLKATMGLDAAEVWTRSGDRLVRTVSVPDGPALAVEIAPEAATVIGRAGVSGPAWAGVWLPALVGGHAGPELRVAPVTNSGELLGLIVVRRPPAALAFDDHDDEVLTELARQVGLALYNVKLDAALQESLDEVRRQAAELRASRVRIVETADAERRRLERDLHDGAQQNLVALTVSVRLAREVVDSDPEEAKVILEQLGSDLRETVQELRNLAHGIYPPLLINSGLVEAIRAAANRSTLPTVVDAAEMARYPQAIEAAAYFCCLEALQNAAKHAGPDATITVTLGEEQGALRFAVTDDGAGFDASHAAATGHGFVNMRDRVGAFGGTVEVSSSPGTGTRVAGTIPLSS